MKKLIGLFDSKKMTPEQIYDKVKKELEKIEHTNLLRLAKANGKKKL